MDNNYKHITKEERFYIIRKEEFFKNLPDKATELLSEQFKVRSSLEQISFLFKTHWE